MDTDDRVVVTLHDGRHARLTKPSEARERRTDVFALQSRLRRGGRYDPIEMTRLRVVLSIDDIDGHPIPFPPCPPQAERVRAYIRTFQEDLERLALAYDKELYPDAVMPLPLSARVAR